MSGIHATSPNVLFIVPCTSRQLVMNISTIRFDPERSFTLPDTIFSLVTEYHPTFALWSDDSPFSTAMRNCILTLTSVLQFNPAFDLRTFPQAVLFLVFQNLSAVTYPSLGFTPHSKTRVVLLTNDERIVTYNEMERYEKLFDSLVVYKETKFVWFNTNEGVRQFTFSSSPKWTKMKMVEISPVDAIHILTDMARLTTIPNFHGEEIVITLINNSVYSYLEPWVNSSGRGWKVGGFHALFLEEACSMMNLSVSYQGGDWYGDFENGTFTPGIYKDLIERKTNASAIGAFLRHESVGLVEFSNSWDTACVRYLVPRPKQLNSSSRVLVSVFNTSLWLAIAISILVSSFVAAAAARVSDSPSTGSYRNLLSSTMRMFFHLLQIQYPSRAEYRDSFVPLLVAWGWMGFILTTMYSCELSASFTKPVFTEKIQTEDKFIKHGYFWGSSVIVDRGLHFDMREPATYKWVTEYFEPETEEDRVRKMRDGNYVIVGLSYGKVFFFREQNRPPSEVTESYEAADECTLKKHIGILFTLGSPYLEGVNLITGRLISGGILQKFEHDVMMKDSRIPPNVFTLSKDINKVVAFTRLPISIFYGPFYLLLCGYLLSATVLIIHECACTNKWTGIKRNNEDSTRLPFNMSRN